jgi:L-rhamnose isomerase
MPEIEKLTRDYEHLKEQLKRDNIDIEYITTALQSLEIETPSWGYGRGGTRFGTFRDGNEPTDIFSKLEEAGKVHRLWRSISPGIRLTTITTFSIKLINLV